MPCFQDFGSIRLLWDYAFNHSRVFCPATFHLNNFRNVTKAVAYFENLFLTGEAEDEQLFYFQTQKAQEFMAFLHSLSLVDRPASPSWMYPFPVATYQKQLTTTGYTVHSECPCTLCSEELLFRRFWYGINNHNMQWCKQTWVWQLVEAQSRVHKDPDKGHDTKAGS